jgi:hypothetical protein
MRRIVFIITLLCVIVVLVSVILLLNPQETSIANRGDERNLVTLEYITAVKGIERLVVRNTIDEFTVIAGEVPDIQGYETAPMNIDSLARLIHTVGTLRS